MEVRRFQGDRHAFVLDANSLIKRCIMANALDDLKADGVFTGGLYAGLNMLRAIVADHKYRPGPVFACFDCGIPAFRLELIPLYKAKRQEKKALLSEEDKERAFKQVAEFEKMLPLLGVRTLKFTNREADDGVAAVARIMRERGFDVTVISGDKDLLQLVGDGVQVHYLPDKTDNPVTDANFVEKVGVPPEVYLLYKAIVGDASDEIQGIPGCAEGRTKQIIDEVVDYIEQGSKGAYHLFDEDPHAQVRTVVSILQETAGKKLPKFKESFIQHADSLHDILDAIDLTDSWGDTTRLREMVDAPAEVDTVGFLRWCKRLKFGSVLANPQKYLRPFSACMDK